MDERIVVKLDGKVYIDPSASPEAAAIAQKIVEGRPSAGSLSYAHALGYALLHDLPGVVAVPAFGGVYLQHEEGGQENATSWEELREAVDKGVEPASLNFEGSFKPQEDAYADPYWNA